MEKKVFHLFPSPRSPAEEFQRGLHRGTVLETIDGNAVAQLIPPVVLLELGDDGFEGDSVQRIIRLRHLGESRCGAAGITFPRHHRKGFSRNGLYAAKPEHARYPAARRR